MSVDWNVPALEELLQRTHMVEVPVGHDDRRRPRAPAKATIRRVDDLISRSGNPGVDQHPAATSGASFTEVHDVDYQPPLICDVGSNFVDAVTIGAWRFGASIDRHLLAHGSSGV